MPMKIIINELEYHLFFNHERYPSFEERYSHLKYSPRWMKAMHYETDYPFKGYTKASLKLMDDVVAVGHSYCSWEDNFNKEIGRKIALTNLLKDIYSETFFLKTDKTDFWHQYFNIIGKPQAKRIS